MNMYKTLKAGAWIGIMMAILVGCRTAPLYSVTDSAVPPVTSGKPLTLANVTKAIVDAGMGLGWEMQVVRPGQDHRHAAPPQPHGGRGHPLHHRFL